MPTGRYDPLGRKAVIQFPSLAIQNPHLHGGGAHVGAGLLWACHDCQDLRPV